MNAEQGEIKGFLKISESVPQVGRQPLGQASHALSFAWLSLRTLQRNWPQCRTGKAFSDIAGKLGTGALGGLHLSRRRVVGSCRFADDLTPEFHTDPATSLKLTHGQVDNRCYEGDQDQ